MCWTPEVTFVMKIRLKLKYLKIMYLGWPPPPLVLPPLEQCHKESLFLWLPLADPGTVSGCSGAAQGLTQLPSWRCQIKTWRDNTTSHKIDYITKRWDISNIKGFLYRMNWLPGATHLFIKSTPCIELNFIFTTTKTKWSNRIKFQNDLDTTKQRKFTANNLTQSWKSYTSMLIALVTFCI